MLYTQDHDGAHVTTFPYIRRKLISCTPHMTTAPDEEATADILAMTELTVSSQMRPPCLHWGLWLPGCRYG